MLRLRFSSPLVHHWTYFHVAKCNGCDRSFTGSFPGAIRVAILAPLRIEKVHSLQRPMPSPVGGQKEIPRLRLAAGVFFTWLSDC